LLASVATVRTASVKTILLLCLATSACAADLRADALRKGEVDAAGVEVVLDGSVGEVRVPFSTPAPDVPADEFHDEMQDAVALRVVCPRLGAAADLMAAEGVWSLSDERDTAIFTFDRGAAGDLVLVPGNAYAAWLSVATNDYVARVRAIALDVSVAGQ
jgi:hypothetical protein